MSYKNLKIISTALITLFIIYNISLTVSFATVNSGYNETGMSPTTTPTPSTPTTSPTPSIPTNTPNKPSPTVTSEPSPKINPMEFTVTYIQFQLKKVKTQRKLLDDLYTELNGKHPKTDAEFELWIKVMNEKNTIKAEQAVLEKLLLDLVPPTP